MKIYIVIDTANLNLFSLRWPNNGFAFVLYFDNVTRRFSTMSPILNRAKMEIIAKYSTTIPENISRLKTLFERFDCDLFTIFLKVLYGRLLLIGNIIDR